MTTIFGIFLALIIAVIAIFTAVVSRIIGFITNIGRNISGNKNSGNSNNGGWYESRRGGDNTQRKRGREGEVKVSQVNVEESRINDNVGEYVDFDEVK